MTRQGNSKTEGKLMARERLPNRHACETAEFTHGGRTYTYQIGRYEDGRIGEVFLCGAKSGSDVEAALRDGSIMFSQLLQFGVRAADIRMALTRNFNGGAGTPIAKIADIIAAEEKKTEQHHDGAANL
jgi:hypothetical protein